MTAVAIQPSALTRFDTVRRPIARGLRTISIITTISGPAAETAVGDPRKVWNRVDHTAYRDAVPRAHLGIERCLHREARAEERQSAEAQPPRLGSAHLDDAQ